MPPSGAFGRRATLRSIRRARLFAAYPAPVRAPETLRGDLQPRSGWLVWVTFGLFECDAMCDTSMRHMRLFCLGFDAPQVRQFNKTNHLPDKK